MVIDEDTEVEEAGGGGQTSGEMAEWSRGEVVVALVMGFLGK